MLSCLSFAMDDRSAPPVAAEQACGASSEKSQPKILHLSTAFKDRFCWAKLTSLILFVSRFLLNTRINVLLPMQTSGNANALNDILPNLLMEPNAISDTIESGYAQSAQFSHISAPANGWKNEFLPKVWLCMIEMNGTVDAWQVAFRNL